MIGIVITVPRLLKTLTGGFASAMALFPFILLSNKADKQNQRLMRHEQIHLYQQLELLIIIFYALYVIEYLLFRFSGENHYTAYRNISFEQEARYYECNLEAKRKLFGFRKYIGKQSQD